MRIDLHLQLQLQVHKKTLSPRKVPDFDPSPLATISTWEAETWYALLCRIDLEPQKVSARTDSIYEIRFKARGYARGNASGVPPSARRTTARTRARGVAVRFVIRFALCAEVRFVFDSYSSNRPGPIRFVFVFR